jgi:WD40 repeat protein
MRNKPWLLLSAGLLLLLTSSGPRGQEAKNAGQLLRTFQGHSRAVNNVSFSPDGKRLVSVSDDATVRIWEPNTGRELLILRGHGQHYVRGVAFSPDGKWLASAGCDQKVVLWDAASGHEVRTHDVNDGGECAVSVAFSPDSRWLVAAGELVPAGSEERIRIWDTTTGKKQRTLRGHVNGIFSVMCNGSA